MGGKIAPLSGVSNEAAKVQEDIVGNIRDFIGAKDNPSINAIQEIWNQMDHNHTSVCKLVDSQHIHYNPLSPLSKKEQLTQCAISEIERAKKMKFYLPCFSSEYSPSDLPPVIYWNCLIKYGERLNAQGYNKLHQLVLLPNATAEMINDTLQLGLNIDLKDCEGNTALHLATKARKDSLVTLLIHAGANIDSKNSLGDTPLHLAALKGDSVLFDNLLLQGADITVQNKQGDTPLHLIVRNHDAKIQEIMMQYIKKNTPVLNLKNSLGRTALHESIVKSNSSKTIATLIEYGTNLNLGDKEGKTALHYIVSKHVAYYNEFIFGSYFEAMKKFGADFHAKDHSGSTALHEAVKYNNNQSLISILVNYGCPINAQDKNGDTALHLAGRKTRGKSHSWHALINKNADKDILNKKKEKAKYKHAVLGGLKNMFKN